MSEQGMRETVLMTEIADLLEQVDVLLATNKALVEALEDSTNRLGDYMAVQIKRQGHGNTFQSSIETITAQIATNARALAGGM